jgi:hypothetical protein
MVLFPFVIQPTFDRVDRAVEDDLQFSHLNSIQKWLNAMGKLLLPQDCRIGLLQAVEYPAQLVVLFTSRLVGLGIVYLYQIRQMIQNCGT